MNSDSNVKEGVCYFLKSRLPTAEGTVNGRKVEVLRDTGCTCCTVKRSLVSDDQLIGKESYVTLIDETTQKYPLAVIDVDCPFFTGKTEALCMEDTLYDLVIGNIDGSKLPDMSHFSAAAVTRSQAKQSEKAYRKLKVPDQIINDDEELKAEATDPVRSVTPSRGNVKRDVKLTSDVNVAETPKGGDFHLVFDHTYPYSPIPFEARQIRYKEMLDFGIR